MDKLQILYKDKATMEEIRKFLSQILEEVAVERTLGRKDVTGIADANDIINKAFNRLDEMYAPTKKVNTDNQAN